ncbi:MAG: hypothetical protein L6R39_007802 [Caloplaca ligustica]|nr:MAG: hypothetical protein L6R39_007802 [Caloplaca ligustica]
MSGYRILKGGRAYTSPVAAERCTFSRMTVHGRYRRLAPQPHTWPLFRSDQWSRTAGIAGVDASVNLVVIAPDSCDVPGEQATEQDVGRHVRIPRRWLAAFTGWDIQADGSEERLRLPCNNPGPLDPDVD